MKSKGFTLVELMIVVAIIGILAAITIPNFMSYRDKAKGAEAKSNLREIKTVMEMLVIDTGEWPNHLPPHDLGTGVEFTVVKRLTRSKKPLANCQGRLRYPLA